MKVITVVRGCIVLDAGGFPSDLLSALSSLEGRLEGRGRTDVKKMGAARQILLEAGGRYRDRTCDPYHVKVVLYR